MPAITAIRTVRIRERPNLIWVQIETEDGLVGLGETFRGAEAVESFVHAEVAPDLIGRDARNIEEISAALTAPYVGFGASSTEMRAASAVDIALWDLAGQRWNEPVYVGLGGGVRDRIRVYNTCAGYDYNSRGSRRYISDSDDVRGPYDDQVAFHSDAGKLAESLLDEGYSAMKIWPFDRFARESGGHYIDLVDLKAGLEPFAKVRQVVGDRIEIMCELHSMWSATAALRICRALEDYGVFWAEDPIAKMDNARALADLRRATSTPICGSETLGGLNAFIDLIGSGAVDVVMLDIGWCGGLSQARKIAALAQGFSRPIAPHDCTGPVALWAGTHLAMHAQTAIFQEVVRAAMSSWYRDLVTDLPTIRNGVVMAPDGPGLGTRLRPEVMERSDAVVVVSDRNATL